MYKQIISEASKVGYKGLSYYRYNRDCFYYASNIIAMSDDYIKSKNDYQRKNGEEYYLGFSRKDNTNQIIFDKNEETLLKKLLESIGKHKLYIGTKCDEQSTILNDIQAVYYIIGHIYEKALMIIGRNNPSYIRINKETLSKCLINDELIENLSKEEKEQLTTMIVDLFTTHIELSNHFDETIKKIEVLCGFDKENIDSICITDFMNKITKIKYEIESLISNELLDPKNKIIEIKNTINALHYLKENAPQQYKQYEQYEDILRAELKNILTNTYIFFYKNRKVFRYHEMLSYFQDILIDPQSLSSKGDEGKPLCEEIYEEIIKDLNNDSLSDIDDKDEFKIFTMRISAPNFCQYRLLYTYEKDEPLCRLEVYSEMIPRIFGEDTKRLKAKTIEQISKTKKYTIYDSVLCSGNNIREYIQSIRLNENTIRKLIDTLASIECLDALIEIVPEEYLELVEEEILSLMNENIINSSEINSREIYNQFVKRKETT